MPPKHHCSRCQQRRAAMKRPCNGLLLCHDCFFACLEDDVHRTIVTERLFCRGDIVACGASGGKDSTVLMHLLTTLNARHDYGIQIALVSIDEGITGYRDSSLVTVRRNAQHYNLPLHILSFQDLFNWTMDDVVRAAGQRSSCTFCGVFRRQALERGARLIHAHKIATGHNADDTAETLLMNVLRADAPRLARSNIPTTDSTSDKNSTGGASPTSSTSSSEAVIPRVKPLKYIYEKEIVLYAHFKKLDYFTTECTYSTDAFRGVVRGLIKELESIRPRCIADTVISGDRLAVCDVAATTLSEAVPCQRCGHVTSQRLCRACVLIHNLNSNAHAMMANSDTERGQ